MPLVPALTDGEPSDPESREAEGGGLSRALRPEIGVDAALNDPEQRLIGLGMCPKAALGPAQGPLQLGFDQLGGRRETDTDVEGHGDIGASSSWIRTASSGVSSTDDPSYTERKRAPLSSITGSREKI